MTCSIRAAKSKGSQFEHDVAYSLRQVYPDCYRTAELGMQRQFDIEIKQNGEIVAIIECKRLKGISWNELDKFYKKLETKRCLQRITDYTTGEVKFPKVADCYVLFQSNHQPCLVYTYYKDMPSIKRFEDVFGVPFIKHKSTRAPKNETFI